MSSAAAPSLAVLKATSNPSSTFAPSTTLSTTLKKLGFMVAIGNANAKSSTSTSPPLLLMQKSESYVKINLQFSMILTPGATFADIEGSYPCPTGGTGGGSGGSGGSDGGDGESIMVVVAGKLPVKVIIIVVVAVLIIGGGNLFCFFGCIAAYCLGVKESITGKEPEDRAGEAAVVEVQPNWTQGQKAEETGVVTAVAGAYPVMTGYQSDGSVTALSSPPQAQENRLGYLFTEALPNAVPNTIITGCPPSLTILRYSPPVVEEYL
ncbi:hypothetical protein EC957_007470 [Mortierella hygrophila]|uniref:Uncharacterized protein n=1 Tax=Mortierella hygrophila TaxID=979708 RepID=A0A9P6K606_9FUNG|nr:hypothetical protein EC957_007470 [Mortierella hygrophila]